MKWDKANGTMMKEMREKQWKHESWLNTIIIIIIMEENKNKNNDKEIKWKKRIGNIIIYKKKCKWVYMLYSLGQIYKTIKETLETPFSNIDLSV